MCVYYSGRGGVVNCGLPGGCERADKAVRVDFLVNRDECLADSFSALVGNLCLVMGRKGCRGSVRAVTSGREVSGESGCLAAFGRRECWFCLAYW